MFADAYRGKRVFLTGNTGFKGAWLTLWLQRLGAEVHGYALEAPSTPSLFTTSGLDRDLVHTHADVRDHAKLTATLRACKPDFVFHLAAEAIVRDCYADPRRAFDTNLMGTVNVLEACRDLPGLKSVVIVTSDKCYENVEWTWGYRETDTLGGKDPYSASKACAEIAASAMIRSYFTQSGAARVSTVRAGNVIGGGDWANHRLVPDCMRSWSRKEIVTIRSPHATRPWQHVLEPLSGYLRMGQAHLEGKGHTESYNFGPLHNTDRTVLELLEEIRRNWGDAVYKVESDPNDLRKEAGLLKLSCDKAEADLNWRACLGFEETIAMTTQWYAHHYRERPASMRDYTMGQIAAYETRAKEQRLEWTK